MKNIIAVMLLCYADSCDCRPILVRDGEFTLSKAEVEYALSGVTPADSRVSDGKTRHLATNFFQLTGV